MFIEERHQQILSLIRQNGRVEVAEISKLFHISEDSARRDLRLMERQGLVKRTYGGAISPEKVAQVPPYQEQNWSGPGIKEALAKTAVSLVQDGDTILLDGSPTIARMVPWLAKVHGLTVVTNSIAIAYHTMCSLPGTRLFIIGGLVDPNRTNTTSIESLRTIQNIAVDKAFISPCSISTDLNLWSTSFDEAEVKKAMLQTGNEIIILADSSKFGQRSLAKIGPIQNGFRVITDHGIPPELQKTIETRTKNRLNIISEGEPDHESPSASC